MAEQFISAATAKALSGSTLTGGGIPVPTTDADEWHGSLNIIFDRLNRALTDVCGLEVYSDSTTTFAVRAGEFIDPRTGAIVTYSAETAQALTASQTNYIFLAPDGTLTVNTTGFPTSIHVPLAAIVAGAASVYDLDDITDYRGRAMFRAIEPTIPYRQVEDFDLDAGDALPDPWSVDKHASATGDYMADEPTGAYQLALTTANAAEAAQLTWGNQRLIDTDKNPIVEFYARCDGIGGMTSVERFVLGLVADHTNAEDALDNIDHSVWFKVHGAADLNVYMEADDGATDTDDTDTGINFVDDTLTVFRIDMSDLTAVRMFVDGVEAGSTLDMTASSGQVLQPIACIQRDDNSQTEALIELEVDCFIRHAER